MFYYLFIYLSICLFIYKFCFLWIKHNNVSQTNDENPQILIFNMLKFHVIKNVLKTFLHDFEEHVKLFYKYYQQKPVLRTGNLGLDLSQKNKTKQNKKAKQNKNKQTNKKLRIKGPTWTFPTTSKRFQIKITDKQTA